MKISAVLNLDFAPNANRVSFQCPLLGVKRTLSAVVQPYLQNLTPNLRGGFCISPANEFWPSPPPARRVGNRECLFDRRAHEWPTRPFCLLAPMSGVSQGDRTVSRLSRARISFPVLKEATAFFETWKATPVRGLRP